MSIVIYICVVKKALKIPIQKDLDQREEKSNEIGVIKQKAQLRSSNQTVTIYENIGMQMGQGEHG